MDMGAPFSFYFPVFTLFDSFEHHHSKVENSKAQKTFMWFPISQCSPETGGRFGVLIIEERITIVTSLIYKIYIAFTNFCGAAAVP